MGLTIGVCVMSHILDQEHAGTAVTGYGTVPAAVPVPAATGAPAQLNPYLPPRL